MTLTNHTNVVSALAWSGEGLLYTAGRDAMIYCWSPLDGKLVRSLKGHGHWVNTLALSSEYALRTGAFDHHGKVGGGGGGTGDVDAVATAQKAAALARYNDATGGSPERLVSGSDDFTLFLWHPASSKTPVSRLTGHQQLVNCVRFSPNGSKLASASFDKSVRLWDGFTGAFLHTLRGHVGPVYQLAWSADSRQLVSSSKDSTLKLWCPRTGALRADLPGHEDEVFAVDWAPAGGRVASGGKDTKTRIWRQ
jgi:ribosome assembly protein 4